MFITTWTSIFDVSIKVGNFFQYAVHTFESLLTSFFSFKFSRGRERERDWKKTNDRTFLSSMILRFRWISRVSCNQPCLEFSWNFRVYDSCRCRAPRRICYAEAFETFMGTSRDAAKSLEAS